MPSRTGGSIDVEKPEYGIFAAWTGSQLMIAISVLVGGLPMALPALAWFAIPIVTLSARFSYRGDRPRCLITLGLMFGVAFASEASHDHRQPAACS